jgi:hypothetical protein
MSLPEPNVADPSALRHTYNPPLLSLEPELIQFRDEQRLSAADAARLVALERRELFSVHLELRTMSYAAVLLIVTGVGIVLKNNFDRIGPLAIVGILMLASAACYAHAIRKHLARRERTIVDDYVLLLAALLFSAAVGFGESQFHLLDAAWPRHFLLLALVHGATAYWLDSRLVLSAALTALAAWLGVEQHPFAAQTFGSAEIGGRALLCGVVVLGLAFLNRVSPRGRAAFEPVYLHFAALAGFTGALSWLIDDSLRWAGFGLLVILAVAFGIEGRRKRNELFLIYAVISSVIGLDYLAARLLGGALGFIVSLLTIVGAVILLFVIHRQLQERP